MATKKGKPPRPTHDGPETRALQAAWKAVKGHTTQRKIADAVGVSEGMVWQMIHGHRTVPAEMAVALAGAMRIPDPASISASFAALQRQVTPLGVDAQLRPELQANRLENDIDSLRWYATTLTNIMIRYRPVEAVELLETMRNKVPAKFRDNGFLLELTEAMAKHPAVESAKEPAAARKRAKPRDA